jgi:hypothetical protein
MVILRTFNSFFPRKYNYEGTVPEGNGGHRYIDKNAILKELKTLELLLKHYHFWLASKCLPYAVKKSSHSIVKEGLHHNSQLEIWHSLAYIALGQHICCNVLYDLLDFIILTSTLASP